MEIKQIIMFTIMFVGLFFHSYISKNINSDFYELCFCDVCLKDFQNKIEEY